MRLHLFLSRISRSAWATALLLSAVAGVAQTVQPLIVEYKQKGTGRFMVTNDTAEPMVVVVEPRSFSITEDGHGQYRPLDPSIHLELSATSAKLQPKQSYYIFYKVKADKLPAWFTIYTTFTRPRHDEQIQLRIQLPHTIYLYQKKPLAQQDIRIESAVYMAASHKVVCEMKNNGLALGRVQSTEATGSDRSSALGANFPMLPGMTRKIEIDWKSADPPTEFSAKFDHFTVRSPVTVESGQEPSKDAPKLDLASAQTGVAAANAPGR